MAFDVMMCREESSHSNFFNCNNKPFSFLLPEIHGIWRRSSFSLDLCRNHHRLSRHGGSTHRYTQSISYVY